MDAAAFPDLPPRRKPLKRAVNRAVMFALGRALHTLSQHDRLIHDEVAGWPDGFTLMVTVRPDGGAMAVSRTPDGRLTYRGARLPEDAADVVIIIRSVETAFRLYTGRMSIDEAYAHHWTCARGDLSRTMSVTRVLNAAQFYLFPSWIARRLMKRMPAIPRRRKYLLRLRAYLLGIPFGV